MKPLDKIELIESSMRCFGDGLFGLLPVIGFPFAIVALVIFIRVRLSKHTFWNPAERYLGTGAFCATIGLGLTLLLGGVFVVENY